MSASVITPPSMLHVVALSSSPSPPYTLLCSAVPLAALFDLWPRLQVGAGGVRCLVQSLTITIRGGLTPTVWQAWTMNRLLMANSLVSGNVRDRRGLSTLFLLNMAFPKGQSGDHLSIMCLFLCALHFMSLHRQPLTYIISQCLSKFF